MSHELDPRKKKNRKKEEKNEERKVYGVSGMATLKKDREKKFRHAKRACVARI